jgi:hypothetical protein
MMNGNLVGFGMVVLSALLIALPGYLLKLPNAPVMIGVGALLVAADLMIRVLRRSRERWLFSSLTGGYLFFIPVWIFGVVVIVVNLINAFAMRK